jgi:hypothetical protein
MFPLTRCHPNLQGKMRYYARLPMEPLRVTGYLGTPYVPADPPDRLHLDGLLAWAVVNSQAFPLSFGGKAIVVPLPVACLWLSPDGLPLWGTSDLRPVDAVAVHGAEYWHKRYPVDRADWDDKTRAITSRGRWKEYRVPLQTVRCEAVQGVCLGHRRIVEELLACVTHVGKKGAMGYGHVLRWVVEPWACSVEQARRDIEIHRPVPALSLSASSPPRDLAHRGWTPPYWYAPWHALCAEPVP